MKIIRFLFPFLFPKIREHTQMIAPEVVTRVMSEKHNMTHLRARNLPKQRCSLFWDFDN